MTDTSRCKKCDIEMKPGKALVNDDVVMGSPDFVGNTIDSRGQTLSADLTKANLVAVLL